MLTMWLIILPCLFFVVCALAIFLVAGLAPRPQGEPAEAKMSKQEKIILVAIAVVMAIIGRLMPDLTYKILQAIGMVMLLFLLVNSFLRNVILGFVLAIIPVVLWWFVPHWATLDFLSVLFATAMLFYFVLIFTLRARPILILFLAIMVYDVWAVFYTDVMMNVAKKAFEMNLPALIYLPENLTRSVAGMGVGDIFIPGLLIMICFNQYHESKRPIWIWAPLIGYVGGMIISFVVLMVTQQGQPATIYLCPTTALGYGLAWFLTRRLPST